MKFDMSLLSTDGRVEEKPERFKEEYAPLYQMFEAARYMMRTMSAATSSSMLSKPQVHKLLNLKVLTLAKDTPPAESLAKPLEKEKAPKRQVAKKTLDKNQVTAILNQLIKHVNLKEERQDMIRDIKEARISKDAFKALLVKMDFPMSNDEKFDALIQVFESSMSGKVGAANPGLMT